MFLDEKRQGEQDVTTWKTFSSLAAACEKEPWRAVLLDAAEILERNGWCQHVQKDTLGAYCLMAAVHRAACLMGGGDPKPNEVAALTAVGEALRECPCAFGRKVVSWNDEPNRTKKEVVDLLQRVATSSVVNDGCND